MGFVGESVLENVDKLGTGEYIFALEGHVKKAFGDVNLDLILLDTHTYHGNSSLRNKPSVIKLLRSEWKMSGKMMGRWLVSRVQG